MPKPFMCDLDDCRQQFAQRRDLRRHQRSKRQHPLHAEVEEHKCETCTASLGRRDNLQKHEKLYHRRLGCKDCKKPFSGEIEFANHVCLCIIRLYDKPIELLHRYICPICYIGMSEEMDCALHIVQEHPNQPREPWDSLDPPKYGVWSGRQLFLRTALFVLTSTWPFGGHWLWKDSGRSCHSLSIKERIYITAQ